jgi:hypothetical protein
MRDIDKIKINEFNNGLIYYLKGECKPVWK